MPALRRGIRFAADINVNTMLTKVPGAGVVELKPTIPKVSPTGRTFSHIMMMKYISGIQSRKYAGIKEFTAMTERLAQRSKDLKMKIVRAVMEENIIFLEWEMTIKFKKNPSSVLYGTSRLTLNDEGKIAEQRDYYDLWGDIFDNIPRFGKAYRKFMKKKFG